MALLAQPPGLPRLLEGFLNLRGDIVPVVRSDRLFALAERAPGLYSHILILRPHRHLMGMLVDSAREVFPADAEQLLAAPAGSSFHDCARAVFRLGDQPVHVLAPDRLLLDIEQRAIADFQAEAERRISQLQRPPE